MKIITDIPPNLVRKIQELIGKRVYKNISEFARIAVENQLALETSSEEPSNLEADLKFVNNVQPAALEKLKLDLERSVVVEMDEPGFKDIKLPEVDDEQQIWLWGQINKIFPVKFAVRYLYNLLKDGAESIALEEFYKKVSALGREVGSFLLQEDNSNGRRRDERFSIAFPIGEEKSKSFSRFCSQFVGYKRTDGILGGALFVLKFANLKTDNRNLRIGITKNGVQFARIKNPIFDERTDGRILSDEEISFYLDHIIKKVPGEASAFFLILNLISRGVKGRDALNEKIKRTIANWSDDIVNTQRAGVISRLYELGLIAKYREGIFVEYSITEKGKEYLEKYEKRK